MEIDGPNLMEGLVEGVEGMQMDGNGMEGEGVGGVEGVDEADEMEVD